MGVRLFSPRAAAGNGASSARSGYRAGREAAAVLLVAAACYLTLALFSLEPLDGESGNWVGPVGAWLAQLLVSLFGVVAWLLPLELVLIATPLLRHRPLQPLGLRLSVDLALGIILAALVQVAFPESTIQGGSMYAGGNVGLII